MKFRTILVACLFALTSGVAYASSCPKHVKAIDAALPKATLSNAQKAEVKKYRDEGEKLHKAGKHADSLATLAKAEKILGIKM